MSFFYVGYLPKAPGTWASLACLPIFYFLYPLTPRPIYSLFFTLLLVLSAYLAQKHTVTTKEKDPGWIVIDEVLGVMVAWPTLKTNHWQEILLLFILFRFFDITKIWPASYYDKKNSGWGIMLDDIVSGIYTAISLIALQQVLNFPLF